MLEQILPFGDRVREFARLELEQDFDGCRLCWAISEQGRRCPENTVLFGTEDYVAIPAVGSLDRGYLLFVSRRHKKALGTLSAEEIGSFEAQFQTLMEFLRPVSDSWLAFEHGSSRSCRSPACCIDHFHFHLLPVSLGESERIVARISRISQRIEQLESLRQVPERLGRRPNAYIMIREATGAIRFVQGLAFESQFVRQMVAAELGREREWDWREHAHFDKVLETIRLFRTKGLSPRVAYFAHALEGIPDEEVAAEICAARRIFGEECPGFVIASMLELMGRALLADCAASLAAVDQVLVGSEVRYLAACDVVLVDLSRERWRYVGCLMEIAYAKPLGVPVVAISGASDIAQRHWLKAHVEFFAPSLRDAAIYIRKKYPAT